MDKNHTPPTSPARWYVEKIESTGNGATVFLAPATYIPDQFYPKVGDVLILEKDAAAVAGERD